MSFHIISYHAHVISHHIISYSCHITFHFISHHFILHHITSHHIGDHHDAACCCCRWWLVWCWGSDRIIITTSITPCTNNHHTLHQQSSHPVAAITTTCRNNHHHLQQQSSPPAAISPSAAATITTCSSNDHHMCIHYSMHSLVKRQGKCPHKQSFKTHLAAEIVPLLCLLAAPSLCRLRLESQGSAAPALARFEFQAMFLHRVQPNLQVSVVLETTKERLRQDFVHQPCACDFLNNANNEHRHKHIR